MAIGKDKVEMYKGRILDTLTEHGRLAKSRIAFLSRLHVYDTDVLLYDMLSDGTIIKIEGSAIILYDLVEKNGDQ